MAQNSHVCESCGTAVTPKEVEDGGAFNDSEHCYCAICVARLMQKVLTAQRGGRMKTAGVVFQKGLSPSRTGAPAWLLYSVIGEAALAAILLLVLLLPSEVKLPGQDPIVKEEVRIKTLLSEGDASLQTGGQTLKALSILQEAKNVAAGHPWLKVVEKKMESAQTAFDEEARGAFVEMKKHYEMRMESNAFSSAMALLDKFPQQYRKTSFWKGNIRLLRQRAQLNKEAQDELSRLTPEITAMRRRGNYDEALKRLRSFPAKFSGTSAAKEVAAKISEVVGEREEEKHRREQQAKKEREAQERREEARKRREEEKQERLAARDRERKEDRIRENKPIIEESSRKDEPEREKEQAEKEEEPGPDEKPKGKPPAAKESKIPWDEVELSPGIPPSFPYATPKPCLMPLQRAAVGNKLLIPFPHKGKVSGFVVEDRGTVITVDTNADGRPDKQLPGEGGVVVLKVSYKAGQHRSCAVEIKRHSGTLKFSSCGWMAGKYNGTRIAVIDENSNGKYNDYVSFNKKKNVKEFKDAVVVGKANGAAALGNIIVIKDEFYEIKVEEDGSKLHIRLHEAPAGKLCLTRGFKALGTLAYATVLGQLHGSKLLVSVELSSAGKPVTVPAGEYFIFAGKVTNPRRKRKVSIYVADKTKNFKIEESEAVIPQWGAPGTIEFEYVMGKKGEFRINPYKIRLFGTLGEEYKYWTPMDFVPRVQVKNAVGKKVTDESIKYTNDFKRFYTFEKNLRAGEKYKVRIIGDSDFLGKSESKWK